jgi:hypothetical protein
MLFTGSTFLSAFPGETKSRGSAWVSQMEKQSEADLKRMEHRLLSVKQQISFAGGYVMK